MIAGTTYLERGQPVLALCAWSGKGPRNVLVRRSDGTCVVRPFRGLRRVPEISPASPADVRSAEALPPCQQAGGQSHQEDHPHPGRRGRVCLVERGASGLLRRHNNSAAAPDEASDLPVLRQRLRRLDDGLHRSPRIRVEPESGELVGLERRLVRALPDQRCTQAPVAVRGKGIDRRVLPAHVEPRPEHPIRARALPTRGLAALGRELLTDCILWTGGQSMGYGITFRDGKVIRAHQAAWLDAGGELLPGTNLHHICGVRLCVNAEHLEQIGVDEHAALHHPPKLICPKCGAERTYRPDRKSYRCLSCHAASQRERNTTS